MSEANQNLSIKEAIILLLAGIYLIAGLAVFQLYSWKYGLLMLAPIIIFVSIKIFKLRKEDVGR